MNNNKLVYILMIVNIIVLVCLGAFLNTKFNTKNEKKEEQKPIVESNDGIKKCTYKKEENDNLETREILVNYSNKLVDSYSIKYNVVSYDEINFINAKNQIEALLSKYQTDNNVKLSDYKLEDNEYNIRLYFDLRNISNSTIIPIQYQQDINSAVEAIKDLDYTCE